MRKTKNAFDKGKSEFGQHLVNRKGKQRVGTTGEKIDEIQWERYLEVKIPEGTKDVESFVKDFDRLAKKYNVEKLSLVHRAVYRETEEKTKR